MAHYFRSTGTSWGTVGDWSSTPSPSYTAVAAIPTTSDDVIFEAASANCVLGANRVCKSINFTTYANTLNISTFTLAVSGNITFQANQSSRISGTTGRIQSAASGTITSNGGTWPLHYQIANIVGITVTLADDMRIAGSWLNSGGGTQTINGAFTIYVSTNITMGGVFNSTSTNLVMNGSGTFSGTGTCNLEINTSGIIVITGTVVFSRRFIITAVGTLTMTAANVSIVNTTTVDVGGRQIGTLAHSFSVGAQTITYLSDIYCTSFTVGNGSNTYNGPGKIYCSGNLGLTAGNGSGTLVVELNGTGSITTGTMGLGLIINTSGTITLGATLTISNSFTYTAGSVNTGTGTVTIGNGVSISSAGINWYNITIPTGTVTINNLMTILNNLTLASTASVTFAGVAGWICANLICATANRIITFQASNTYITTTSASTGGTAATGNIFTSSSGTIKAIWTLLQGATQSIVYTNGTRIDSSLGQTIWSFGGVLTDTINWGLGSKPRTISFTFI